MYLHMYPEVDEAEKWYRWWKEMPVKGTSLRVVSLQDEVAMVGFETPAVLLGVFADYSFTSLPFSLPVKLQNSLSALAI